MGPIPLELEEVGGVTVVRITSKRLLETPLVDGVSQGLLQLASDPGRVRMLLDFSAVESLSSAVLAALLSLRRILLGQGGRLVLCGLRPEIREVFAIAGLEKPLNICSTEQEALQSF